MFCRLLRALYWTFQCSSSGALNAAVTLRLASSRWLRTWYRTFQKCKHTNTHTDTDTHTHTRTKKHAHTHTQNAQNTAHVNSYAMWNASSLGAGPVLERLYVPWLFARECRSTSCISISSISHILPLARYPLNTYPHQDVSIQLLVLAMRLNHYGFVCLRLVQKVEEEEEEEGNKLYWALQTRQVIAMGLTSLPLHLPLKCRGAFALKSISLQLAPILLYLLPGLSVRLRRKWEEYTCLSVAICHFKMVDWRCCVRGLKVDGGASLKEANVSDWKATLGGS